MRQSLVTFLLLLIFSIEANAQTSPNLTYGQVPTAGQWNQWFANKQDVLGYAPLSLGGGTMLGKLNTQVSSTGNAGLNLGVGSSPGSPINGDLWVTSSGLFAQVNGETINISAGGSGSIITGTVNSIPYYSSTTQISALAKVNNAVLETDGSGVPSLSTTLPSGLTIPSPVISGVASFTGSIGASSTPVSGTGTSIFSSKSITLTPINGLLGNLYFDTSWKYFGNGEAGSIVLGNSSDSIELDYASPNSSGSGFAATPIIAMSITDTGAIYQNSTLYNVASGSHNLTYGSYQDIGQGSAAWDAAPVRFGQPITSSGGLFTVSMSSSQTTGNNGPLLQTNGSTSIGNNVLHFSSTTGVQTGMFALDESNPDSIYAVVTSITSTTVTLSQNVVSPGVSSGDNIQFNVGNFAGPLIVDTVTHDSYGLALNKASNAISVFSNIADDGTTGAFAEGIVVTVGAPIGHTVGGHGAYISGEFDVNVPSTDSNSTHCGIRNSIASPCHDGLWISNFGVGHGSWALDTDNDDQYNNGISLAAVASGGVSMEINNNTSFEAFNSNHSGAETKFLIFDSSDNLLLNSGTGGSVFFGTNGTYYASISSSGMLPNSNGSFNLGGVSNKWGTLYTTNAQISSLSVSSPVCTDSSSNLSTSVCNAGVSVFNNNGSAVTTPHISVGSIGLSGGTGTITFSGSAAFTGSATYSCTGNDLTTKNNFSINPINGSSASATGSSSDVLSFICVGN